MRIMWKFIMVMYFIALVGSRGTYARLPTWRTNNEDIGRGFDLQTSSNVFRFLLQNLLYATVD
uniref:Uncharacterized protein n=1 Tax=Brassica oleracea TaxID=3712 RepID=A0A3P6EH01_BRAOL|nr:unnamed protein product [Brassica oleracea]